MWILPEKLFRALAVLFVLGLPMLDRAAPAQPVADDTAAGDRMELRVVLEQRYEVLPIREGVLLKPRRPSLGVRSIELSGDSIAVNGERVTAGVLRAWLGEEADPILRLQALPPSGRRALFDLAAGPATAEPQDEPEEQADTDLDTDVSVSPEAPEAPEPPPLIPAPPQEPDEDEESGVRSGSQVNFGGGITVGRGEIADEAVAVKGPVRVEGEVLQDVLSFLGSTRVNGTVGGEVVAVMGSVTLGPNAEVMGDVTSIGGSVRRAPGAKVHGSISEVALAPMFRDRWRWHRPDADLDIGPSWVLEPATDLFGSILGMIVLALLVCLVLVVARRPVERVELALAAEPWKAALTGIAAFFLFLPLLAVVSVLLALTIVGCVLFLLYPFLFLAIGLFLLLGYAAGAYRVGRWMEFRFDRRFGSPYLAALVGVLLIQVWSVLADLFGLGPGPLGVFAFMFALFGMAVQTAAWVVGIGAVLLARFGGARPRGPATAAVPPAPVVPTAPLAPLPPEPPPAAPPFPESWEGPPRAEGS